MFRAYEVTVMVKAKGTVVLQHDEDFDDKVAEMIHNGKYDFEIESTDWEHTDL